MGICASYSTVLVSNGNHMVPLMCWMTQYGTTQPSEKASHSPWCYVGCRKLRQFSGCNKVGAIKKY